MTNKKSSRYITENQHQRIDLNTKNPYNSNRSSGESDRNNEHMSIQSHINSIKQSINTKSRHNAHNQAISHNVAQKQNKFMRKYNQSINSGGLISPEVSLPSIKNHEASL